MRQRRSVYLRCERTMVPPGWSACTTSRPRPIAKAGTGTCRVRVQGQAVDNHDGIVLDHDVQAGNPPDTPQLAPAVQPVTTRPGRAARTVTDDQGYGDASVDQSWSTSCSERGDPPQGQTRANRHHVEHRGRSAEPLNGEPVAKAGSAPSNAHAAGTAAARRSAEILRMPRCPGPRRSKSEGDPGVGFPAAT